jgi:neuropeptide FF receptor 2
VLQVDHKAGEREQRMKLRITVMMLTVIIIFALFWLPLYSIYTYYFFADTISYPYFTEIVISILRPVFQWLSICTSCINPILYACFSNKFRAAFQQVCRCVHATRTCFRFAYCPACGAIKWCARILVGK